MQIRSTRRSPGPNAVAVRLYGGIVLRAILGSSKYFERFDLRARLWGDFKKWLVFKTAVKFDSGLLQILNLRVDLSPGADRRGVHEC